MDVAELLGAVFNVFLVVLIVSTMVSAGFTTTLSNLGSVLSRFGLVAMVLIAGLVVRPLVGWATAELFSLDTSAYIALVLVAAVPGAPLGVKFVMGAKADVVTGAVFQVLLAVIASITFAPTANFIIEAAELGEGVSLPVRDLIVTIAFLQILPFVVGLLLRHFNEVAALEWNEFAKKVSGPSFLVVIALALLGSWQTIIDLIGSKALLAGTVFPAVMILVGYVMSSGDRRTRAATALIEPGSNAGPAFAAVAIAFNNDPLILGTVSALIFMQILVAAVASGMLAKGQDDGADESPANSGTEGVAHA